MTPLGPTLPGGAMLFSIEHDKLKYDKTRLRAGFSLL
jgi:hypothetical protein